MPLNALIPLSGQPVNIKPVNPIQQMAQLSAIKSQETQNKLAQMGYDKKVALDNAAKASFDANGMFNHDKYIQNLSQVDPVAAQNYMQAQKLQKMQMDQALTSMDSAKLSNANKRASVFRKVSGAWLNQYHDFLQQNNGNVEAAKQAMQPYYMKEAQNLEKQYGIDILKEHPVFDPSTAKYVYDQSAEAINTANQIKLQRIKNEGKATTMNDLKVRAWQAFSSGNATPSQKKLIGADKDPYLVKALQEVDLANTNGEYNHDLTLEEKVIKAKEISKGMHTATTGNTSNNDPLGLR